MGGVIVHINSVAWNFSFQIFNDVGCSMSLSFFNDINLPVSNEIILIYFYRKFPHWYNRCRSCYTGNVPGASYSSE